MAKKHIETHAQEIVEQFDDLLDITVTEVEERLNELVNEYKIPTDEARRSAVNTYMDEAGVKQEDISSGGNTEADVVDVLDGGDEEWVDMTVKVVDLWEANADSVAQVGLAGDETGTVKFTNWEKADLETLEEDQVYRLENLVTDEYQDRMSVKLNSTTDVEAVDKNIEVEERTKTVEGAVVDIKGESGLIERCPEDGCTRVLDNDNCQEHGEADDGIFDTRIKAVIDDGHTAQDVILDSELTEALTGISLEEAQEIAMDELDRSAVISRMKPHIMGHYYHVEGPVYKRYILADEVEEQVEQPDTDKLLIKARSI